MKRFLSLLVFLFFLSTTAHAGEADVIEVKMTQTDGSAYHFDVTVRHADDGWQHYANKWDVMSPDGTILGTRILAHPHIDEQPFTRGLGGVKISKDIKEVIVRAHDLVHGYGGKTVAVTMP